MKQFYVQDTSSQVAGQVCPGDHKTMQPIAIAFDCPLKLNGKTSLIKTSHTLFTRHGGIRLVLTKKTSPLLGIFQTNRRCYIKSGGGCYQ